VQQQAGGRLVDVLADADQLGPGLMDRQVDRHVVGTAARQPIYLVHNHVLDRLLADEVE
jgi:hypothetical protein